MSSLTTAELVAAVERVLVARTRGQPMAGSDAALLEASTVPMVTGAVAAISSRFLAVGTPRSVGLVGGGELAAATLAAHRIWFSPRELRCAPVGNGAAFAASHGGRVVTIEEACAADIVVVSLLDLPRPIERAWVRGGTHLIALHAPAKAPALDDALLADAVLVVDRRDDFESVLGSRPRPRLYGHLGEVVAGHKDGRQLDEITIFVGSTGFAAGLARG